MSKKSSHPRVRGRKSVQPEIYHTPYGDLNLAKPEGRKAARAIILEIKRTTDALTRKDLADWRRAWQLAINVDNPDRRRLYDIYRDVDVDLHLTGCIEQRNGFVLSRSFKLVNSNGDIDKDAIHIFDQAWFKQLMKYCLESNWWGHSLIELGDITTDSDGCICYDDVRLIPRKHVIPEYHRCVINVGDDWRSGIDYHDPAFSGRLIECGRPDDLGRYLKAAQATIPKKNALSFWDAFAEIFGMPMRVAKTTTRDDNERRRLQSMLDGAGSNLAMVVSAETDLQVIESGKGDAFNVYDKRIDRANSELSKLSIGQTMTIEDGASLSQSETHLKVFENIVEADRDMLRDTVNNQLLPRMVRHGFPVKGLRFEWDDAIDYTPEQQISYETMIADRYEVDQSYFADKYGMPVGERRDRMPVPPEEDPKSNPNDDGKQKNGHGFFD